VARAKRRRAAGQALPACRRLPAAACLPLPACRCRPAAAAAGGEEAKPVEDNRSWLAKNWLFVAACGVAVLNTMLKATGGGNQGQGGRR
jgi:hypothetical protein